MSENNKPEMVTVNPKHQCKYCYEYHETTLKLTPSIGTEVYICDNCQIKVFNKNLKED